MTRQSLECSVFLAIGSNLGNKASNLQTAIIKTAGMIGIVSAVSSIIETEPWGFESSNSFLNMVIQVETSLSPTQVLHSTQAIEKEMGRTSKSSGYYQDRLIDIDLILYDDLILNSPKLTLPHPHLHERLFVLKPLCEIASTLLHPVFKKNIQELLTDFYENNT